MAITETARLLATLELQDKFSPVIKTVEGKIDSVGRKFDAIGASAQRGVDTARTKFGQLKDAAKNTNNQIGAVGIALAGLENFVPPSIRPLVRGLEDLNNLAPKGIPGLVSTALQGLKTITATTVTVVGQTLTNAGVPASTATGAASLIPAVGVAGLVLAATQIIGPPLRQFFIENGLAGSGSNAGKSESQLARERADAATAERQAQKANDLLSAISSKTDRTNQRLEDLRLQKPPTVNVNLSTTVKTNVFGTTATTTTTYNRFLPGGIVVV